MITTALLFPGQGSQEPNMRELVERCRPGLLKLAEQVVGDDPFERMNEGTGYLQPVIFCASLAGFTRLGMSEEPAYYAGHSLGEISALVAAESLSVEDGMKLVALRGRLMQRAAEEAGDGAMLAVGTSREEAGEIAQRLGLTVANDNSPDQVVLSGGGEAIAAAKKEARGRGLRAVRLAIKGAFHSPAMAEVVPEFEAALAEVPFARPRHPVFSCVTAEIFDDPRRRLAESLTQGVRWVEILHALHGLGVRRYLEVGPGDVLTGLVKRTLDGVEAQTHQTLEVAGV